MRERQLWTFWLDWRVSYADLIVLLVVVVKYEVNGVCSKIPQNGAAAAKLAHARDKMIAFGRYIIEAAINAGEVNGGIRRDTDCPRSWALFTIYVTRNPSSPRILA